MIVRVQGSGQYRLEDGAAAGLNALDGDLQRAVDQHDREKVTELLYKMIAHVQAKGQPIGLDEVLPSDAILPPSDLSYDEIVTLLKEDGLVPG